MYVFLECCLKPINNSTRSLTQLHKSQFMMQLIYLHKPKTWKFTQRCLSILSCLLFCMALSSVSYAQNSCSELFFSEYIEGSGSSNKALEIYNPSSDSIDLSNYQVQLFRNGNSEPTDIADLEGIIAPGGTFVICNNNAEFDSCQFSGGAVMTFNGDDAIAIFNETTASIVDLIGVIGEDPGSSWPVGEGSTSNNTLVRTNTVTEGTTDWSVGATQWSILDIDDVSGLGMHDFDDTACDSVSDECTANAGTLAGAALDTCFSGEPLTISATPNGDQVVPEGYSTLYVLTQGNDLIIQAVSEEPTFDVSSDGLFTIHTLIYNGDSTNEEFLDLSVVVPGETSGVDVLNIVTENDICASLDVAGAPFDIEACSVDTCQADAGTLAADPFGDKDCLASEVDSISISATPTGDANVPEGYSLVYVLTTGEDLVILATGEEPSFTVQGPGVYTIHTLVYVSNPELNDFLDLGVVVPGETTGADVLDLIKENEICASLDATGAPFVIEICTEDTCEADAGTLTAVELTDEDCIDPEDTTSVVSLVATPNGDIVVPDGYSSIYVLTSTDSLVIEAVADTPTFAVAEAGLYTIHTLVYDGDSASDNFLDLSVVEFGKTTGGEVIALVTEAGICASLDVAGAAFDVTECESVTDTCEADAGTLTAVELTEEDCIDPEDSASVVTITATPNDDIVVPDGYSFIYVLTTTDSLVIVNVADTPSFEVADAGLYTIHTLVYDGDSASDDFLDLGIVVPGETKGGDVLALVTESEICASLDVAGAAFDVTECETVTDTCEADAGTLTAVELTEEDCIDPEDSASVVTITATPNDDIVVPDGYSFIYVLTTTDSLVIVNVADTPSFEVADAGLYTIHTLVYDGDSASDDFLDLGVVVPGETKGGDVLALVAEAGICASLDVAGAAFDVTECESVEPAPNGLFFSEYVEGNSSNKALEIYNASGVAVDLSNYLVQTYVNGDTVPRFELLMSGTLEPGEVYVICNANIENSEECDTTASVANFNGDDAVALINVSNGDTLDIIGVIGEDPGSEWEVVDGTTQNHTIIRFPEITEGTTDWTQGETEWFALPVDVFDSLGSHTVVEPSSCLADAGTLTADELGDACIDVEDSASVVTISATPNGDIVVPDGYSFIYVLTSTDSLVIENVADTPAFEVAEAGLYTIHTLVYVADSASEDFLDLGVVVPGETKGGDVLALVAEAGICASLDVAGATFDVKECTDCLADAGTLTADDLGDACIDAEDTASVVTISATPNGDIVVPEGYSFLYVLTSTDSLVIENVADTPAFDITEEGLFTIHTLVYVADSASEDFLDLGVVVPGETKGGDVLALVAEAGICASLDVAGAAFEVPSCDVVTDTCEADAGTLTAVALADEDTCFDGSQISLEATPNGDVVVPDGYSLLYVLTRGDDLVIQRVNTEPSFDIAQAGVFTIHTLVYVADSTSDDFLDLSVVVPGETTGGDVLALVTEAGICASLDVTGARFEIPVCPGSIDCPEECVLTDWKADSLADDGYPLNHAIYLYTSPLDPDRENGNDTDYQRFVWETEGKWTNYGDSAVVTGTVVSKVDTSAKFEVLIIATNPKNWEEWSAGGGTFMAQMPEAAEAAEQNFMDWSFWIISEESKLTGTGSLEGIELMLSHVPVDLSKGLQVGIGANDKDGSFGISGWFGYTGEFNGRRIGAAGDINVDLDLESCTTSDECGEIIAPTIVGDISTRVLPTEIIEVSWEVVAPQIYTMASKISVEKSVNGGSYEMIDEAKADAFTKRYTFYDSNVSTGDKASYRIKSTFKDGTADISRNAVLSWESNLFEAYPNPVSNILSVRAINPLEGEHLIRLYDINGREVMRKNVSDFRRDFTIDMRDMGRNLYIMQIASPDGEVQTLRISVK